MKVIKVVLSGLGAVNRGWLQILLDREHDLLAHYGLSFRILGVADSSGIAISPQGFSPSSLLVLKNQHHRVADLPGHTSGAPVETIFEFTDADLLIESTAGNLPTGQPGLDTARQALSRGIPVVLANKVPLVLAYDELHYLAKQHQASLAFSATVCGGLPVINVLQRDLVLSRPARIQGIFNATSNYILHILEQGGSLPDAIREAQRLGAAEADPTYDTHGHDTANKLFIIMKSFSDFRGSIQDIPREGLQNLTPARLQQAARDGYKVKILASAIWADRQWKLSVQPTFLPATSFLGSCDGWEMGLEIETDLYHRLSMKIYEPDPVATCAAVMRDVLYVSKQIK